MNRISLFRATTFAAMLAAAPAVALAAPGSQGTNDASTSGSGAMTGSNTASQSTMSNGSEGSTTGQPGTATNAEQGQGVQVSQNTLKSVQQQLQQAGYYKNGRVDGKWGPSTSHAVMAFQQSKGIQATGHLDKKTLTALGVSQGG